MTPELLTMLGIGVAIVGLNWRMVHGLRQEMHAGFAELRQDVGALRERVIDLGERVARLEGAFSDLSQRVARLEGAFDGFMGRREPSEGRTA